jgi:hypothetical protein
MAPKFFKQRRKSGTVLVLLVSLSLWLTGCCTMKKPQHEYIELGVRIVQVFHDGIHIDTLDKSFSLSEAKAEVTSENYRGKTVYLAFPNDHEIAKLKPNDAMKCRINRRIVEEHLIAMKDPAKAYSRLNSPDFKILEINVSP